jgi:hypothetical protein
MATIGPRAGLGLGALVALLVAFGGALAIRRRDVSPVTGASAVARA